MLRNNICSRNSFQKCICFKETILGTMPFMHFFFFFPGQENGHRWWSNSALMCEYFWAFAHVRIRTLVCEKKNSSIKYCNFYKRTGRRVPFRMCCRIELYRQILNFHRAKSNFEGVLWTKINKLTSAAIYVTSSIPTVSIREVVLYDKAICIEECYYTSICLKSSSILNCTPSV